MTVTPISSATRSAPHLHEPFLERASGSGDQRGHALGAFLMLRLVDRIAEEAKALKSEALAYQLRACMQYIDEIYPQTEEVTHLREIVRLAESASDAGNKRLLWAPLLAYGYWLEQQLRLDESLDVLDSTLRLENASAIDEKIAAHLQRARVLHLTGRFTDANHSYAVAGEMANLRGDLRSQMVSRIGRAIVLQKTGDLPQAEAIFSDVLHIARQHGDAYVEARALHDLAVTNNLMNRVPAAVAFAFEAYQKYDEPHHRGRALSDMGMFLKELEHYAAAKEAFLEVLANNPTPKTRVNTVLELLELTAQVQDRLGFERWRRELESGYDTLPPAETVDFEMKMGFGLAAFGSGPDAIEHLSKAVELAERYRFGQRVFEGEALLKEIKAGRTSQLVPPPAKTPEIVPELQSALEGLYALRSGI